MANNTVRECNLAKRDKKYRAKHNPDAYEVSSQGYATHYDPLEVRNTDPYDENNSMSMINLAPKRVADRMKSESVKSLLALGEDELETRVAPNLLLRQLRTSFWVEYETLHRNFNRAASKEMSSRRMRLERICYGLCSSMFMKDKIIPNDYFLAWMVRPPMDYDVAMKESLNHGLQRLRQIIDLPMIKTKVKRTREGDTTTVKELDVNVANVILKTVAFLDLRVKGAIPQKLDIQGQMTNRSSTVNVNMDIPSQRNLSIDDIDKKITQLTEQTAELLSEPRFSTKDKADIREIGEKEVIELEKSQNGTYEA